MGMHPSLSAASGRRTANPCQHFAVRARPVNIPGVFAPCSVPEYRCGLAKTIVLAEGPGGTALAYGPDDGLVTPRDCTPERFRARCDPAMREGERGGREMQPQALVPEALREATGVLSRQRSDFGGIRSAAAVQAARAKDLHDRATAIMGAVAASLERNLLLTSRVLPA